MDRRAFLAGAAALLAAPLAAEAQPAGTVPRIGVLSPSAPSDPRMQRRLEAFQQGLRELGYVEGRNIAIESRWAEGRYDRLPALAAELVRLKVNVILTMAPPPTKAAKDATTTIPIVMGAVADAVTAGFVSNLARPEGNITGLSMMVPELVGKQLEILKEVVPKLSRVVLLGNPANPSNAAQSREAKGAARILGLRLQPVAARDPGEIDSAFVAMTREKPDAVIVLLDSMFLDRRTRIADLSVKHRLPTVYGTGEHAEAGGLMTYGPNIPSMFRRAATYVDRILRGARPAELPVEQPTKFELIINLKTAKALGLTIPPSLLLRADQVIE
jgi:putative tryptophan/tyrosine transport system substrate-binding protein